jgi:2'-5' RNA ligase
MRIFVALDIEEAIRDRISRFMDGVREFAPDARWVRPESLHVTLKFIGEKPAEAVEQIKKALAAVQGQPVEMSFRGHGFFPTAKSARVFWVGIESGPALASLANAVDDVTAGLGIPKEERAFNAHLTLARGGGGSGSPRRQNGDRSNKNFQRLQEKLSALSSPDFGTMTAHEFFLYQSQLSRGGSRYTKIARFALN